MERAARPAAEGRWADTIGEADPPTFSPALPAKTNPDKGRGGRPAPGRGGEAPKLEPQLLQLGDHLGLGAMDLEPHRLGRLRHLQHPRDHHRVHMVETVAIDDQGRGLDAASPDVVERLAEALAAFGIAVDVRHDLAAVGMHDEGHVVEITTFVRIRRKSQPGAEAGDQHGGTHRGAQISEMHAFRPHQGVQAFGRQTVDRGGGNGGYARRCSKGGEALRVAGRGEPRGQSSSWSGAGALRHGRTLSVQSNPSRIRWRPGIKRLALQEMVVAAAETMGLVADVLQQAQTRIPTR